jgi:hypothetical protein
MADFFRSFLPLENPIGFGAADYLELLLAALMVALALVWRPRIEPRLRKLAGRAFWSMALLAALPVALRLLLLPHHPAPTPDVYDEFSHLLVAGTLRHFRLANPMLPMRHFFETFFVLQQPSYSSIYPLGQGIFLAIGWSIFGHPWAGVLLAAAAFSPLCYWMLRGWTSPAWSLAGAALAIMEFGPLNLWMNSYWGGMPAAATGCLVFGALPRLRHGRRKDAVLLGVGLAIHLLTRPYESIFLLIAVIAFFLPYLRRRAEWRPLGKAALVAACVVMPAIALTLVQDKQVTGSWTTLPYTLSQYQYGVPTSLTVQPKPVPHLPLTPQQQLDYRMQTSFRPARGETVQTFLARLEYRVRYYRFYFLPPLYLALLAFLTALGEYRFAWVAFTLALFAFGTNFFPAFQVHYIAAATCLFVLVSVAGLERISRWSLRGRPVGFEIAGFIFFLCAAHFLFWYGVHLCEPSQVSQDMRPYESWDAINHGNPERRIAVNRQLAEIPGKLLIFVRYSPLHMFQEEWVWNAADPDAARVVWARDLGSQEDQELLRASPDRQPLLFEPDARPMRLTPYQP